MARAYVPDRGDLVWLDFDPQIGHEQAGRRPALVLSPRRYNEKTGLAVMVPITSHTKGYPFEVALPSGMRTTDVVLADQLKCVDWTARKAKRIATAPEVVVRDVLAKIVALIDPLK